MKISSKLNELKSTDLNCNVFDVYSYDSLTMQELLCQFFTKINECIKTSNDTIDLASWLVNEGLKIEVVKKLMLWLEDGTLENIINVNLFNSLNTKIDKFNEELSLRGINILNPPDALNPCICDGITDDSDNLQNIITYAYQNNFKVLLPPRRIKINKTITIPKGVVIEGQNSLSWNYSNGTIITTDRYDLTPVFLINDVCVKIKDLKIHGNDTSIGIQVVNSAYDFNFENIKIKNCDLGFDIQDSWTYVMNKCRTESCRIGFNILNATSSNFISCVAFQSSEYGFYLNGLTYTTFLSCGSDGSSTALFLDNSNRGVTFTSFGIENTKLCGIKAVGDNVSATFTGLNFGTHGSTEINLIDIDSSILTFTDFKLSNTMSPTGNGKIFNISDNSHVVLINPYIFGNVGDVEKCTIIGGNLVNRLQNKINAKTTVTDLIQTGNGKTKTLTSNEEISLDYKLLVNSTYILTAHCTNSGAQSCTSIISISNAVNGGLNYSYTKADLISNSVEFIINSEGVVSLKNNSSNSKAYNWSILRIR